jgi:hypothetical protein
MKNKINSNLKEKEPKHTGESDSNNHTGNSSDNFKIKQDFITSPTTKYEILHHHPQKAHNSPNLEKAKEIIEKQKLYKLKNYFVSTGAMKFK